MMDERSFILNEKSFLNGDSIYEMTKEELAEIKEEEYKKGIEK